MKKLDKKSGEKLALKRDKIVLLGTKTGVKAGLLLSTLCSAHLECYR
jgi:hypothetical protein